MLWQLHGHPGFSILHLIRKDIVLHKAQRVALGLLHRIRPSDVALVVRKPPCHDYRRFVDKLTVWPAMPLPSAITFILGFHRHLC